MNDDRSQPAPAAEDAHRNDPRFVEYYAQESASARATERAHGIRGAVLRARARAGLAVENLNVADVGCNAGTQSRCWLECGHRVTGLDISRDLVALARERSAEFGERARFEVGTATRLPWESGTFDVCLLPELLEHVDDWRSCLEEGVRVLKPGGALYLSTTNVLCPVQQEFTLPGYSWYPAWVKRRIVARSLTTHRRWVNYASYPALHWFSPYGLSRFLSDRDVKALDRFDLIDLESKSPVARLIVGLVRAVPPIRLLGHIATPSTTLVGLKNR
jgi:2-polyprenyl-6-hydroxyphenyl methylase/3-demethylubiquinone-9 3-methyltransferase